MRLGAITIDTEIFERTGFRIETGLFKTLAQFKNSDTQVVVSDVIHHEVLSHIEKRHTETKAAAIKTLNNALQQLIVTAEQVQKVEAHLDGIDGLSHAEMRLKNFYESVGAELIKSKDYLDIERLVSNYFESKPPFAESGTKKHEFPDAIALLSLEAWARKNHQHLLVVSHDGDWKRFCEQSNVMDCVEDLAEAINKFQEIDRQIEAIIDALKNSLIKKEGKLIKLFKHRLAKEVSALTPKGLADSDYQIAIDNLDVIYKDFRLSKKEKPIELIWKEADKLVLKISILITIEVGTNISLSEYHPIYEEIYSLGKCLKYEDREFAVEILVDLDGDYNEGLEQLVLSNLEIVQGLETIDFGYVQPTREFSSSDE